MNLATSFKRDSSRIANNHKSINQPLSSLSNFEMYQRKDYYGIYKNSKYYQQKLTEIAETKQQIKHYVRLVRLQKENILSKAQKLTDSLVNTVKDYFIKRGKIV